MDDDRRAELEVILAAAQAEGFLGRAPLSDHVQNGLAFAAIVAERPEDLCVDLGSGGGVPALVVVLAVPALSVVCVDRGERRCAFLREAAEALAVEHRVSVRHGDAEALARSGELAARAGWVTARSFGPPAVTAEAAARYLRPGGELLVSEPPDARAGARWEAEALAILGLEFVGIARSDGTALARCRRDSSVLEERYPRRAATVRKRPLF